MTDGYSTFGIHYILVLITTTGFRFGFKEFWTCEMQWFLCWLLLVTGFLSNWLMPIQVKSNKFTQHQFTIQLFYSASQSLTRGPQEQQGQEKTVVVIQVKSTAQGANPTPRGYAGNAQPVVTIQGWTTNLSTFLAEHQGNSRILSHIATS